MESKEIIFSNPINTEILDIEFDQYNRNELKILLKVSFGNKKIEIWKSLNEIKIFFETLKKMNFSLLPTLSDILDKFSNNNNKKELIDQFSIMFKYLNYRFDILSTDVANHFFTLTDKNNKTDNFLNEEEYFIEPNHNHNENSNFNYNKEIIELSLKETLDLTYSFKLDDNDMTLSDFVYNTELGLLAITFEDKSILSSIGRFWSLVDYEVLGSLYVYQRLFSAERKPYFKRILVKNFDTRVSKVEFSLLSNKLIIGLENGVVQLFNIKYVKQIKNMLDEDEERIFNINEGNNFHYLKERITGLAMYDEYLIVVSRDNKLIIVDIFSRILEVKFNGSLSKRIEGKGYICGIIVDERSKMLLMRTITNKIIIYDIITEDIIDFDNKTKSEIKINFKQDIETPKNIKNFHFSKLNLYVALDDMVIIYAINNGQLTETNRIPFNGTIDSSVSYSAKYLKLDYRSYISAVNYYTAQKLLVVGLCNGVIIAINTRSMEVIYSRFIESSPITKLQLLDDNGIIIKSNELGSINFFKFGN